MATYSRPALVTRIWARNPTAAIRSQSEQLGNAAISELLSKDKFYWAPGQAPNFDWPNPQPPRLREIGLRSFLGSPPLNLIGQDTFFGAPGQVPANLDWQLPTRARPKGIDLVTAFEAAPVWFPSGTPFFQSDQPLPVRPLRREIGLWNFLVQTNLTLIGQDKFFGVAGQPPQQKDFPNPFPPKPRGRDLVTFAGASNANLFLGGSIYRGPGQVPTYDWPNPQFPRARFDLARFFDNPPNVNLIASVTPTPPTPEFWVTEVNPMPNPTWTTEPGDIGTPGGYEP